MTESLNQCCTKTQIQMIKKGRWKRLSDSVVIDFIFRGLFLSAVAMATADADASKEFVCSTRLFTRDKDLCLLEGFVSYLNKWLGMNWK